MLLGIGLRILYVYAIGAEVWHIAYVLVKIDLTSSYVLVKIGLPGSLFFFWMIRSC